MTARQINIIRRRFGMTQQQFARMLGVSVSTVLRWEQGAFTPNELHRAKLRALDVRAAA